jgi:hypothetical protein
MNEERYKCPKCGCIGTEEDMEFDCIIGEDGEECCCDWICPECGMWQFLDDYEIIQ